MFEEKKDKALKTIAKKDQKLAEISDVWSLHGCWIISLVLDYE
jgi:hypothetical protein